MAAYKLSFELLSEIEEAFSCCSSSNDTTGFLLGKDVTKLCGTLGLSLNAMLIKYYKENDSEKVYFETFKKIVSECFALWEESADGTTRGHTSMDEEITGKSSQVMPI
jgi:hypothetical protein